VQSVLWGRPAPVGEGIENAQQAGKQEKYDVKHQWQDQKPLGIDLSLVHFIAALL
jgi:hypothetical protein